MSKPILMKPDLAAARKRSKTASAFSAYELPAGLAGFAAGKTYLIDTYGCQANEADSEKIAGLLSACGFVSTDDAQTADLVVFNTCAIRQNAENKVFGELGRIKIYKERRPGMKIAVGGCMPQEEAVVEKILKTYDQVDVVFGTHNLHELPALLFRSYGGERIVDVRSVEGDIVENVPRLRRDGFRAWVGVMFGCDEFCTYCIVPYTRGKERSRRSEDIVAEVAKLVSEGVREVTLLGQNVNSYGLDFTDRKESFADLLRRLQALPIERIRFTTSHPKDFSDELIAVLATGGNLMPYVHLPVQSGSDRILRAMNRKYTAESYLALVRRLRQAIPDVSLTTDVIVGFPGETEADFQSTLDLVVQAGFEGAYTFVFSPRTGTPAAGYLDETPRAIKDERLQKLNLTVNEGFLAGNRRFVGRTVGVLVEGRSTTGAKHLSGHTEHNKICHFEGPDALIGTIVNVLVTDAKTWSLLGEKSDHDR
ncbi:MAG: tRNA (N6-isopentenyl adenosine(37)-C2)-methylthiotransferase MiaB [Tenericutes bacterium GWF2_57_13]|nr:MAG: tRNA (N6-isopentenyl adenosine(37)-C2)-methylthiotransferase MiaB [Tenericutes bacterium GWF2_57_13]